MWQRQINIINEKGRSDIMSSVDNITVCEKCGEEYWYTFDCRTKESHQISECNCKENNNEQMD